MRSSPRISIAFATYLVACLLCVADLSAQPRRPTPPNLKPGTIVDVDDWGKVKQGEFVEVTRQGWIKVRLEDGEVKDFWAKDVRVSKTKKLKSATPKSSAAVGGGLSGPRTWSDATGKFKIEASFGSLAAGKVELKKTDGSSVSVPLDKLSAADQDIARALANSGGAATSADENPFEAAEDNSSAAPASPEPAEETVANDVRRGDSSQAKKIELVASGYRAPSISATPATKFTSKGIALPSMRVDIRKDREAFHRMFSESPAEYLLVDTHRNHLWVPIEPMQARVAAEPVRVERLDLATGKAASSLLFPPLKRIVDVDASGKLVLAIASHDWGKSANRLDLLRVTGSKVDRVMQFEPYGEAGRADENGILSASVVGTTHLLTASSQGEIVLWQLPTMKPIYLIECGSTCAIPTLSADEKVLAVANSNGVFLLDALSGDVLGQMEASPGQFGDAQLAFDPTNAKLALAGDRGAWVFDVASGKVLKRAVTPVVYSPLAPVGFATDKYLLIGKSLVDLDMGLILCNYKTSGEEPHTVYGGRFWCVLTHREGQAVQRGVAHFELPQPEAVAKSDGVSRESMLAVRPGEKVGIQLNLSFSAEETQKIKDALIKAIQNNGWVYSDESPVAVLACEVTSQSKNEVFRSFRGEEQNVTLTDYTGKAALRKGDKVAWERTTGWYAPRMVFAKEGEAAAEVAKHKPDWQYFTRIQPPKESLIYPEGGALCTATIDISGVKTGEPSKPNTETVMTP